MRKSTDPMRREKAGRAGHNPPGPPIVSMSFQPTIPRQVTLPQSLPPLHRMPSIVSRPAGLLKRFSEFLCSASDTVDHGRPVPLQSDLPQAGQTEGVTTSFEQNRSPVESQTHSILGTIFIASTSHHPLQHCSDSDNGAHLMHHDACSSILKDYSQQQTMEET